MMGFTNCNTFLLGYTQTIIYSHMLIALLMNIFISWLHLASYQDSR